jgi:hypothetical protein
MPGKINNMPIKKVVTYNLRMRKLYPPHITKKCLKNTKEARHNFLILFIRMHSASYNVNLNSQQTSITMATNQNSGNRGGQGGQQDQKGQKSGQQNQGGGRQGSQADQSQERGGSQQGGRDRDMEDENMQRDQKQGTNRGTTTDKR